MSKYRDLFGAGKHILGMIHLAGERPRERVLEEIKIYKEEGLTGAIIENYHGDLRALHITTSAIQDDVSDFKFGVNILRMSFPFNLINTQHELFNPTNICFTQIDSISKWDDEEYLEHKPNLGVVFGGCEI